ncbi:T9SS sorting signal type C domain-containing protein [bacterium]|nr:MAG: T9SS sorting signal type C domain-containing protein [bacterium]
MPTCPEGDFYVYSQADIDLFAINYPNCTEISGSLFIQYSEDITNFTALSNITSIAGNIEISENYNLTNLNGLTSITSINGGIYIYWNPDLVDISGLINIDHATINELYIADNEGLSVCNISNFCTYLSNPENERTIEYNNNECSDNYSLSMQCDFNFCPSGYVEITSQEEIDNFTTIYPNCTQITGSLQISGDDITDLSPLNGIESVSDWFSIYDCPQLTEINGLTNLTHIGTDIYIGYNNNLTSLEGLSGVTHSTNYIYIEFNPLLESLTGLNYLSTFEGQILIVGNENLTDISNLQAIEAENIYYLNIEDNENLEICNLTNFCAFLSNPDSYYYISGNSQNCSSAEIILGNCLSENCDATTIWNGNFWTNGIPDNTKKVIIEADLFVSDELEACKLVINEGTLIIESGAVLRVEGIIENNLTAENLIVHSGADLIQTSNDSNIGEITVYRNSSPLYRQDYTLWSSPVKEQNLRSFSPQTVYNRFYSYDTTIGTKGDYAQELFTTADVNTKNFIDAKGYMIRMPNNWTEYVDQNTPGTTFEGQFVGAANNGNISIPISTANIGLNLVGNPYASAISITEFFTANPTIANTLYFWRKRNDALGSGYATYTALGLQSSHLPFGSDLNDKIMPGQGFFIMTQGPTTLTFNNAMRTTSQDGLFLRSSNTNKHRYWLNLTANNNIIGQTLIGYTENATQGIDNGLDGAYFNDSSISLTSLINESEFAIQARSLPFENNDIVPLGFKTNVDGTYKISLHAFDGFFEENQDIYIKDNYTGNEHNLKLSDYEFVTSSGIFNNRFNVIYQTTLGTKNPEMNYNSIVLYKQNNQIHINSGEVAMKKVELYDVSGRLIYTKDAINDTRLSINQLSIENQMLIVKIHLENNTEKVRKIVY